MYAHTVLTQFPFQLANAFDERQRFDIAYCSTDFRDHKVKLVLRSQQLHISLDLVGDMRNNLHSLAQIIALAFLIYHTLINTTCRNIVRACSRNIQKTFIMSQVQVRFMSVYGYITFTVLIRVQCTRIDINVGVKLLDSNLVTSRLKEFTQ